MSVIPVRWNIRPFVTVAGLLPEESTNRVCWQVEVEPTSELMLGQRWSLDISNVDWALQPLTVICGERFVHSGGDDTSDLLTMPGYTPKNATWYELLPGKLNTIIIDPVDKVFWVEEPEVMKA